MAIKVSSRDFEEIILDVAKGYPLSTVLKKREIESWNFLRYIEANPEKAAMMDMARSHGMDEWAEELLTIHEGADLGKARLKSDNIKWLLSRLRRSKYGDSVNIQLDQKVSVSAALEDAHSRVKDIEIVAPQLNSENNVKKDSQLNNDKSRKSSQRNDNKKRIPDKNSDHRSLIGLDDSIEISDASLEPQVEENVPLEDIE